MTETREKYLLVSDFDKTLSLEDSGYLLSEKLGISPDKYRKKIEALRARNLVQLGGEFAYLIISDADYKGKVNKSMLFEVGKEIKLKKNVKELMSILHEGFDSKYFVNYLATAAPFDIVACALEGMVPKSHIFGTMFVFDENDVVCDIQETGAGDAKVNHVDFIRDEEKVPRDRIVYVGDGLSDMRVMLHVKVYNGYSIAVSESSYLSHICNRTVISDNALTILIPILEDILGYQEEKITDFFAELEIPIGEWKRAKVEWVDLQD